MSICRLCSHPHPDLRLVGCNCLLHARCTPLSLIVDITGQNPQEYGGIPNPVKSKSLVCPVCKTGCVSGIKLFPMSFQDLDRAIELRKQCAQAACKAAAAAPRKRSRDDLESDDSALNQIQAESSFLLLSHTRSTDRHQNQRTGRWSTEEVNYCDALLAGFDRSCIPLPHGVKLNEFLGDMLMCKSSRLTKKMKNAKLSTRSFLLNDTILQPPLQLHECMNNGAAHQSLMNMSQVDYCVSLSAYQAKFIESVPSEPMQLELRFNMTKLWRTHFSNLCLQVGYDLLDGNEWLASLEEMEQRASEADDMMRKARRRRMELALKQDVGSLSNAGVFIGGVSAQNANNFPAPPPVTVSSDVVTSTTQMQQPQSSQQQQQQKSLAQQQQFQHTLENMVRPTPIKPGSTLSQPDSTPSHPDAHAHKQQEQLDSDDVAFLSDALEMDDMRQRAFSEDFSIGIEDFLDPLTMVGNYAAASENSNIGDCGPFLEKVIHHIEKQNLPFQHADVWVPSFLPDEDEKNLRLFHAGHATRSDIDSGMSYQLHEYGVYSTNFSFAPGVGLPGRVYTEGRASWESQVCNADPDLFERAGGARVYGVNTAVGIPLETTAVGRIILVLYSTLDLPKNEALMNRFAIDFAKWTPQPKWKLVIELGDEEKKQGHVPTEVSNSTLSDDSQSVRHPQAPSAFSAFNRDVSHNRPVLATQQPRQETAPQRTRSSSTPTISSSTLDEQTEQRIASLLGDHMPIAEAPGNPGMMQHFMSLRLLLLRSDDRRSTEERGYLDVILRSFHGYSKCNKRTDAELANLIARDWMFLSASSTQPSMQQQQQSPLTGPETPSMSMHQFQQNNQHQCHVMSPSSVQTTTSAIPTAMPTMLPPTLFSLNAQTTGLRMLPPQHTIVSYHHSAGKNNNTNLIHRRHSSFDDPPRSSSHHNVSAGSREVSPTIVPES